MTQPMTVGMIGVANFGGFRRDRMRETGLFKLAAAFDRSAENLAKAGEQDGAKACGSVEELLATPGLEGLVVSTGADSHADLSIRAMRAGLHVFVEKPLCCSVDEVQRMRAAAEETGKVVGLGHGDCGTSSEVALIQQYLAEGRLGTLACYEENSSHSGGLEIRPGDWRGLADRNPGGMLFQCGVHALHRLYYLFGPVATLQAMMRYDANPNTQTADVANVLIRHQSGLVGTLNCYHVTAYCHELRLFGTKGNLYIDGYYHRAWFQERKRGPEEPRVEVPLPAAEPTAATSNLINWFNACRGRGQARPSLEEGIQAVLPVFAAEIAAREKREVDMREFAAAAVGA